LAKNRTLRRSPAQSTTRQVLAPTTKEIKNTLKALKGVSKSLSKRAQALAEEVELQRIERLLGEDFDNLHEAQRGLFKETKKLTKRVLKQNKEFIKTLRRGGSRPAELAGNKIVPTARPIPQKPAKELPPKAEPKPPSKAWAETATRTDKFKYAQKIGKKAYHRRVQKWWEDYPDEDPGDNPYTYHGKD